MTAESIVADESDRSGEAEGSRRPTRRGVLLGASLAGLGGLGGALAGCSTAAVPYGANEAGVVDQNGPAPSTQAAMPTSGGGMSSPGGGMSSPGGGMSSPGGMQSSPGSARPGRARTAKGKPKKGAK